MHLVLWFPLPPPSSAHPEEKQIQFSSWSPMSARRKVEQLKKLLSILKNSWRIKLAWGHHCDFEQSLEALLVSFFAEVCFQLGEFRGFPGLIWDFTSVVPSGSGMLLRQFQLGDFSCLQFDHLPLTIKRGQQLMRCHKEMQNTLGKMLWALCVSFLPTPAARESCEADVSSKVCVWFCTQNNWNLNSSLQV